MTIKIFSENESFASIYAPKDVIRRLSELTQFRPEGYLFNPKFKAGIWDGWIRPIDRTGKFPKGLLTDVCTLLEENGYNDYKINDVDFPPFYEDPINICSTNKITDSDGNRVTPYFYQLNGVNYILENKRGIILAPTGAGKSLIIYLLTRSLLESTKYKKILILVPNISLVEQLYSDIIEYTQDEQQWHSANFIHRISAGKDKQSELPVFISTWQSIYSIKDKEYFEQFDAIIVDETHKADASSITSIVEKCINARTKVGLSGTLKQTKLHLTALKGLFGPIYKTVSTSELMEMGILTKLSINAILLKYKEGIPKLEYKDELNYIVGLRKRNKFIVNLLGTLENQNSLVLFQLVEKHGKVLYEMIKEKYPDRDVFLIYGQVKGDEREEVRRIIETKNNAIIVASYQTFQEGINIKKLHNVIFASPSKSSIRVFQSIGRALRKHKTKSLARLYDIADDTRGTNTTKKKSPNHTLNHFKERAQMYFDEGFDVKYAEMEF